MRFPLKTSASAFGVKSRASYVRQIAGKPAAATAIYRIRKRAAATTAKLHRGMFVSHRRRVRRWHSFHSRFPLSSFRPICCPSKCCPRRLRESYVGSRNSDKTLERLLSFSVCVRLFSGNAKKGRFLPSNRGGPTYFLGPHTDRTDALFPLQLCPICLHSWVGGRTVTFSECLQTHFFWFF